MRSLWTYLHPVAMLAVLALGALALREGLALRSARTRRRPQSSHHHRRLAKLFVLLLLAGFCDGILSMAFVRRDPAFESMHAYLATATLALAASTFVLGRSLERGGAQQHRHTHALLGAACVLLALASALAGVALLS